MEILKWILYWDIRIIEYWNKKVKVYLKWIGILIILSFVRPINASSWPNTSSNVTEISRSQGIIYLNYYLKNLIYFYLILDQTNS